MQKSSPSPGPFVLSNAQEAETRTRAQDCATGRASNSTQAALAKVTTQQRRQVSMQQQQQQQQQQPSRRKILQLYLSIFCLENVKN
ncbi:hypothetical protein T07_2695 [Trichinella nelsoni]|uniref:Uncharacterized protein n=1 Tax=Trichinella nelsoni TaxID=6336 RepID=A0A0V0S631_9BILA|nr:hypothetical protein T07_2695 [Trichinella nelsoni]